MRLLTLLHLFMAAICSVKGQTQNQKQVANKKDTININFNDSVLIKGKILNVVEKGEYGGTSHFTALQTEKVYNVWCKSDDCMEIDYKNQNRFILDLSNNELKKYINKRVEIKGEIYFWLGHGGVQPEHPLIKIISIKITDTVKKNTPPNVKQKTVRLIFDSYYCGDASCYFHFTDAITKKEVVIDKQIWDDASYANYKTAIEEITSKCNGNEDETCELRGEKYLAIMNYKFIDDLGSGETGKKKWEWVVVSLKKVSSFEKNVGVSKNPIVGIPKKLGSIEIAEYDFPNAMDWDEAKVACTKLGNGWRLPTKAELNIMYLNKDRLGSFSSGAYWGSSKDKNHVFVQDFTDGTQYPPDYDDKNGVRAVRSF